MRLLSRSASLAALITASTIVGCSSPTVRLQPQGPVLATSPTPSGVATTPGTTPMPSPTPSGSATATASPTHTTAPTASPTPTHTTAPTPIPTGTGSGSLACNAPVVGVPGNYLSISTYGQLAGNTFTADINAPFANAWEFDSYAVAPTPSPTPTTTATPVPTATPTMGPTATPTPSMYSIYTGVYTVTAFSGSQVPSGGTTPAPFSVAAQTGCFELLLVQPVGGTIGQARPRIAIATPNPADNSEGFGSPNFSSTTDYTQSELATGAITQLTIGNLSASKQTGSGTFTLDSGASGTVSIQGAETVIFGLPRAMQRRIDDAMQRRARRAR
jgi:hypothetical protein